MVTLADPLQNYPAELVQRSGKIIWRAFRKWVELEDCQQEAWVAYFTYRKEFDKRIADGEEWYVGKAIRNWVAEYARKQKALTCGYSTSDEEFYTRRKVRAALEFFLCGESIPSPGKGLEGKVKSTASDGTESHVELLDIGRAWEQLDQPSRDALALAYGPEEPPAGTYGESDRQKARRALGRLLDILNSPA